MRAILVSVDYADILAYTLPWNRQHFTDVLVVTSKSEKDDITVRIADSQDCTVYRTDTFYARGAKFNKWGALEEALDLWGRKPMVPISRSEHARSFQRLDYVGQEQPLDHWLCLMDADILWPRDLVIGQSTNLLTFNSKISAQATLVKKGQLCTPLRRMFVPDGRMYFHKSENLAPIHVMGNLEGTGISPDQMIGCTRPFPPEELWRQNQIHRNITEWAGYSQIFHLEDPMLPPPPWHDTEWVHAGGADSFFQMRWPTHLKVRPFWECLHIGDAGMNWMGRQSHYLDGRQNPLHAQRHNEIMAMWRERRRREREYRGNQEEIFRVEKLPPES